MFTHGGVVLVVCTVGGVAQVVFEFWGVVLPVFEHDSSIQAVSNTMVLCSLCLQSVAWKVRWASSNRMGWLSS